MSYEREIESIEAEWSLAEEGFFWRIRQGIFVAEDFDRTLKKLSDISIKEDTEISRRLVSLLWFIPIFMEWQIDRIREAGGDMEAYMIARTSITSEIERLLGVP